MATNKNRKPNQEDSGRSFREPKGRPARNDSPETSAVVLNAAKVLEYAMRERGLTDAGLAQAVKDLTGSDPSAETIRQKRHAKTMLSLVQLDEFALVLDIPITLFLQPFSETKFFFARELADLEKVREELRGGGPDLGLRDSRWNHGTPACDPEIGGSNVGTLAAIGS